MTEIVNEKERIAFWDELAKGEGGFLKGKKILVMSSGKQDAVVGAEAGSRLQKLGAEVMVGGSDDWFIHDGASGEYAYVRALDDVDAVIMVSPIQNREDNGMIRSMMAVASKALEYEEDANLLAGQTREVKVSGASKVAVINPRRNSPSMSFLSKVGGGKHEMGANTAGVQLLAGLKTIMTMEQTVEAIEYGFDASEVDLNLYLSVPECVNQGEPKVLNLIKNCLPIGSRL